MRFPRIRRGIEGKNENLMSGLKICTHIVCSHVQSVNAVKMITPKKKPVIDPAGQVYQVR